MGTDISLAEIVKIGIVISVVPVYALTGISPNLVIDAALGDGGITLGV